MSDHYIYYLIDPRDHAVFYVGQTKTPEARLQNHRFWALGTPHGHLNAKGTLIRNIMGDGYTPLMRVIDKTDREHADGREVYWFLALQKHGCRLLNHVVTTDVGGASHRDFKPTPFLTIKDCYLYFNITEAQITKAIKGKRLPALKVGHTHVLIHWTNALAFFEANNIQRNDHAWTTDPWQRELLIG